MQFPLTRSGDFAIDGTELLEFHVRMLAIPLTDPLVLAETGVDALAALVAEWRDHIVHDALKSAACATIQMQKLQTLYRI